MELASVSIDDQLDTRRQVILACGATASETDELLAYNESHFQTPPEPVAFPMPDESFVETWREYADAVARAGTLRALFGKLPQMRFPVRAGISTRPDYLAATRRGIFSPAEAGEEIQLLAPESCRVEIYATAAGRLPIVTASLREDFVLLAQALSGKNEPIAIPPSMGACLVSGYTNWDRIRTLQREHEASGSGQSWQAVFADIKANKHLYQDRFILLSSDAYSGVDAAAMGIDQARWIKLSHTIRLEHECTHYFTRRVLGSMRNNVLDELIADYFGICAALGYFRADWLLRFWGLESYPAYREGGRIQNYRGNPALSDGAFLILQGLARQAAENLEAFDRTLADRSRDMPCKAALLCALTSFTLEQMAAADFVAVLHRVLESANFPLSSCAYSMHCTAT